MKRQLQEIFEECLERLNQGESIESCLMSYPEHAADLEILLRTVLNVNWRASMVQPRPEFNARARAQFIGAQHYAAQAHSRETRQPGFFGLHRVLVPTLASVFIILFASVGTAAAASNAMPDEPLYAVKLATEQVQVTLSVSDEAKAELNTKLVETRSQEIAAMATKGKTEQVMIATEVLALNLEAAERAIQNVEEATTRQAPVPIPNATTTAPVPPVPTQTEPVQVEPPPTTAPSLSSPTEKPKDATGEAGEQPKPTTQDRVTEAEKLRHSLKASISKNLTVLENAQNKASDKTKEALQRAIDITKKRQTQLQQPSAGTQNKPGTNNPVSHNNPDQDNKNHQNDPGSTGIEGEQ